MMNLWKDTAVGVATRQMLAGLALIIIGVVFLLGRITGWHLYLGIGWIAIGVSYAVIGSQKLRPPPAGGPEHPRRNPAAN